MTKRSVGKNRHQVSEGETHGKGLGKSHWLVWYNRKPLHGGQGALVHMTQI